VRYLRPSFGDVLSVAANRYGAGGMTVAELQGCRLLSAVCSNVILVSWGPAIQSDGARQKVETGQPEGLGQSSCGGPEPFSPLVIQPFFIKMRDWTHRRVAHPSPRRRASGRALAIWKAMIVLVEQLETDPDEAEFTKNVIGKIIADHRDARLDRG